MDKNVISLHWILDEVDGGDSLLPDMLHDRVRRLVDEVKKLRAENDKAQREDATLRDIVNEARPVGDPASLRIRVMALVDELKTLRKQMRDIDKLLNTTCVRGCNTQRRLYKLVNEVRAALPEDLKHLTPVEAVKELAEERRRSRKHIEALEKAIYEKSMANFRAAMALPPRSLRPEVLAFAKKMEEKLRQRDDRPHWRSESEGRLLTGLHQEVTELLEATLVKTRREIAKEAVDVANYAMFIADKVGELK